MDTLKKVSSFAFVQNYLQSIFENNFSFTIQTIELENELEKLENVFNKSTNELL